MARGPNSKGFTLVEILIVVLILGILAAVALPKFSNASAVARASMLADDLRVIRTQVEVYAGQHNGVPPGYPGCDLSQEPTPEAFKEAMTKASNRAGTSNDVRTPDFPYGPYLREMPENPVNDKTTVQIIQAGEEIPEPDDSDGWMYQPSTGIFRADSTGEDDKGVKYCDY